MKTAAQLLKLLAEAADDAAKAKILDEAFAESTKSIYDSIDTIVTSTGATKEANEKTHTFVERTLKGLKDKTGEIEKATKEAEKAKTELAAYLAKAPDIESLKTEHAKAIEAVKAEHQNELGTYKAQVLKEKLNGVAASFSYSDTFKEQIPALREMHLNTMLANYEVSEQNYLFDKKTNAALRDDKGLPISAEVYLSNQLKPFFKVEGTPPNGAPTNPGQKPTNTTSTTQAKMEWVKTNNIDVTTREGQQQLREAFPTPTKEA